MHAINKQYMHELLLISFQCWVRWKLMHACVNIFAIIACVRETSLFNSIYGLVIALKGLATIYVI
jgi:hypothetical protein